MLQGYLHLKKFCKFDFLKFQSIEAFRLTDVGRSWASIGAVVTILSLIYDPFIQALIKVSERVIYKDNPASIVHKLDMYPHYECK